MKNKGGKRLLNVQLYKIRKGIKYSQNYLDKDQSLFL